MMRVTLPSLNLEIQSLITSEIETMWETGLIEAAHELEENWGDEFTIHKLTNGNYDVSTSGQSGENIPKDALHILTVHVAIPWRTQDEKITVTQGKGFSLWDQSL